MKDYLLSYIAKNTDKYFTNTKKIVIKHGDKAVVYAVFLRKPAIYACKNAMDFLQEVKSSLGYKFNIYENFQEGDKVAAGEPLFFLEGSFVELSEIETLLLQTIGLPCLCAWNAYTMAINLPCTSFVSMIARHCINNNMVLACEYGASVGSKTAQKEGALGFIACSTDNSAHFFGKEEGVGTMPHSLVGYAGSTLEAAKMYYNTFKPTKMAVLVDYYGKEITDTLELCNHFKELINQGELSVRLDTHGARFLEGLNNDKSYEVIEKYVPSAFHEYKDAEELNYLLGMGVSIASIFYLREVLDTHGFNNVKILASSGFNLKKCSIIAHTKAPVDSIGTGSYIPSKLTDTYATADIVSYDGELSVKTGREFLIKRWELKLQTLYS